MSRYTEHVEEEQSEHLESVGSPSMSERRKWWRELLLLLFVFSPAIFCGAGIYRNAVNIPTWDDWERGVLLEKYYEGTLDFKYLNGAHIDHRMLFPRLIQLGVNELTEGNLRAEIFVSYGIFVLGGVAIFLLVRRTFGRDSGWVWPTAFLVNAVLFCPLQYQNFLWAVQLAILIPIACLPVVILIVVSKMKWWKKLLTATTVAIIGTHSFAHGILLWPVAFCLALLLKDFNATWKQRTAFLAIFGACAAIVISAYFLWDFKTVTLHSYGNELGATPPSGSVFERIKENPERFKRYFLFVLGSPFARIFDTDPLESAKNVARGSIFLFALGVGYLFWRRKENADWDRLLPWMAMGAFSICAAVLMASGRCDINVSRALLPRYVSLTMFLGIAIIGIAAFVLRRWQLRNDNLLTVAARVQVALVLAALFAGIQFSQWIYGFHKMEAWRFARLQERAALLYIKHFTPGKPARLDTSLEFAEKQAKALNKRGLLKPALFDEPDFGIFTFVKEKLNRGRGAITGATVEEDRMLYVEGYAVLPDEERMADGVLWAWRVKNDSSSEWQLLAPIEMMGLHVPNAPYIDSQFGNNINYSDRAKSARWRGRLDLNADVRGVPFPEGKIELTCFAMDTDRMELHPFKLKYVYDSSETQEKRLVLVES